MDVSKTLDCASIEEKDLVSRYVGRNLSPEEAEAFEEHYFGCDRCWAEVQQAAEVRAALKIERAAQSETPVPATSSRVLRGPWRSLAYLAAAAAIVFVAAGIIVKSHQSPVEELIRAAKDLKSRPMQARLSGPFPYRPLEEAFRGLEEGALPLDLRRAALDAQKFAKDKPSLQNLRAAGLGHLLVGELDQAIARLEEAKNLPELDDPELLNDLAAAYLARAERTTTGRSMPDLNRALEAVDSAIAGDPRLPPARFNKALVLEALGLSDRAEEAWNFYLQLDSKSEWADEARRRLGELSKRKSSELWKERRDELDRAAAAGDVARAHEIVFEFPEFTRLYVQDEVLPAWGRAFLDSRQRDADRLAVLVKAIAAGLESLGDSLVKETVPAIEAGDRSLAAGLRHYGLGRSLYKEQAITEAATKFRLSEEDLSSAASSFRGVATLSLASCRFYANDLEGTATLLARLRSRIGSNEGRYPSLLGQVDWMVGLTQDMRGYPDQALRSYQSALTRFEQLRESGNAAAVHSLLGTTYRYLGDIDRAWSEEIKALVSITSNGTSHRLHEVLGAAARSAHQDGLLPLAALYSDYQLAAARRDNDARRTADALLWRSLSSDITSARIQALKDLEAAQNACSHIREPLIRERLHAQIRVAQARLIQKRDPQTARDYLSEALNFFQRSGNHIRSAEILLQRGRLGLPSRRGVALADFLSGIDEIEAQRERVPEDQRVTYFESSRSLFDQAVAVLAAQGDAAKAFEYAERSRARLLLDLTARPGRAGSLHSVRHPLSSGHIARLLPSSVALIEYYLLPDRLLIWVIHGGALHMAERIWSPMELERLNRALVEEDSHSQGGLARLGSHLHEILIRPVSGWIANAERLVFVPDKWLNDVPFSALVDEDGRYLVERYDSVITPSASFHVYSRTPFGSLSKEPRLLVVGNPALDHDRFPGLPVLRAAAQEARSIASLYPRSVELEGDDATPARFLDLASRSEVVHFAGHALSNGDDPGFSLLALAPDHLVNDGGALYARRISATRLPVTRLAVLAACSTVGRRRSDTEGAMGVARGFLASGVPMVIATLWPVDDRTPAALLTRFHRAYLRSNDPVQALREAQLSSLTGADSSLASPASWAAFQAIGAANARKNQRRAYETL